MRDYCIVRRGVAAALISLLLALAACDKFGSGASDAETEAGRANADAMSREHAGDTAGPSEGALIPPEGPVLSQTLTYADVDDELVHGTSSAPKQRTLTTGPTYGHEFRTTHFGPPHFPQ